MKTEILFSLLAAFICSASADSTLEDGQPEIDEPQPAKRIYNPELNELVRRRKRNSNFRKARQCCAETEESCCGCCVCCKEQGTTNIDPYGESETTTEPPTTDIYHLGPRNFTIVLNSPHYWIIIFIFSDPSCTNCRRLDPIIKEIVRHYSQERQQPRVRIGIFYADYGDHKIYLTNVLRIFEYPSVYLYLRDKTYPYNYGIPKTADELIISVTYLITRPAISRGNCASMSEQLSTSSVYELNDRFFKETVVTCTDAWVVNFYLAWPDVCKNFFQVFEDAARQLNGRVKFGAFYQTKGSATLDKYGVTKRACWVKMFPRGDRGYCVLDFNNGTHSPALDRTLVQWVQKYLDYGTAQKACWDKPDINATTPRIDPPSRSPPQPTTPQNIDIPSLTPPPTTTPRIDIHHLGSNNFTIVWNSPDYWIIIFIFSDPSCTNCRRMDPIIKEIVRHYNSGVQQPKVRIGIFYVDYGDHKIYLTNVLRIFEYPSVYLYLRDKTYPYNYGIPKTADELIISVTYLITRPPISRGNCASISEQLSTSSVYELNDRFFKETVVTCTDAWVVNFYLAWPDVCRNFFQVFEDAARQLNGRVKFGAFYQTNRSATLDKYGVTKRACWVKMFPRGGRGSCVLDFNNGTHSPALDRTLVQWVQKYLDDGTAQKACGEVRPDINTTTQKILTPSRRPPTTPRIERPTTTTTPRIDRPPTTTTPRTDRPPTTTTPRIDRPPTTTTPRTERPTTTTTPRIDRPPTTTTPRTDRPPTTTTPRIDRPPTTTTRRIDRPPTTTTPKTDRPPTTTTPRWTTTATTKKPISSKSTSPTPRTTSPVTSIDLKPAAPGGDIEKLPETPVNEAWCKFRCCIVYFLSTSSKCQAACQKTYMMQLVRSSERYETGCAMYYVHSGKRPDFESTFNINKLPMILVVTTETQTYVTRDGVMSEPVLDKFIDAYVRNKLPKKKIPTYVAPPCESEACKR